MKKHNTLTVWEQMRSWLSRNLTSRTVCNNNIQLKKYIQEYLMKTAFFCKKKKILLPGGDEVQFNQSTTTSGCLRTPNHQEIKHLQVLNTHTHFNYLHTHTHLLQGNLLQQNS